MRSLEQFIQTVKGQNNVWLQNAFKLVPGGFSDLINLKNLNSNLKKLMGFRNMQEKLKNAF